MAETNINPLIERLRDAAGASAETTRALLDHRREIEANTRRLEAPQAALQLVDDFVDLFNRSATECERIAGELAEGVRRRHVEAIRQIASNLALEQRRILIFRDKWVNKPLPYEDMRPVLTAVSGRARDQVDAYRALKDLATELEAALPQPADSKAMDRRALFTRLIRPPDDQ